ncbi:ABC transporter substrate-binding protein [Bosea sp. 62]|uniref:ABC transporter substrate-binding protein n=1 Tax=unclassified Bosea (in: a-proteobacteria) TaxID=2653178 RepID=UPI001257FD4A|nr:MULTISPECIES: ABC transporter substrate-binding protein [unclassified Bosea (in: a-proteobacteria)]CAD5256932.1 ABC transporter substrate-binding protein [Bosea sp. 7B]CAD5273372.1 ABC transporter substrate-binding protein [Bosea sp. 21B]CAD5284705.1 ABC transporter substrate-binding protein [Bosea sp. 46]VVT60212.1 Iron complex transport system substrate-binding protein [Bosea sp. EC-HK365B]VXB59395.1 ABC transporter substrate-binding protein [Bosea sp. 62]
MTRLRRLGLILALIPAICSAGAAEPVRLTDALGRVVEITRAPQRIVPIFASNTELVAALGLSDRVVGIEAYTRYPPEVLDRPQVGGRLGFSVDAIVAQRPELLIVTPSRQAMHLLIEPMRRLGIPVIVLLSRSVAEVMANLRLVGRATGEPDQGDAVAKALEQRLAIVEAAAPMKRPSVVMITGRLGNGLVLVARADSYTGDAMVKAGGRHALERTIVAQVSPEAVIAADPDILLFAGRRDELDALVAQPGWRLLRAVRSGSAHLVARAEFLIPGPRTVDGIEKLAALLRRAAQP